MKISVRKVKAQKSRQEDPDYFFITEKSIENPVRNRIFGSLYLNVLIIEINFLDRVTQSSRTTSELFRVE